MNSEIGFLMLVLMTFLSILAYLVKDLNKRLAKIERFIRMIPPQTLIDKHKFLHSIASDGLTKPFENAEYEKEIK